MDDSMLYYFMIEPEHMSIIYHSEFNTDSTNNNISIDDELQSRFDSQTAQEFKAVLKE